MSQLFFFWYPKNRRKRRKCDGEEQEEDWKQEDRGKEHKAGDREGDRTQEQKQCNFYDVCLAITYFLLDAISGHTRPSFPSFTSHAQQTGMRIACKTTARKQNRSPFFLSSHPLCVPGKRKRKKSFILHEAVARFAVSLCPLSSSPASTL